MAPFVEAGVPGLHVFTGRHRDYHTPRDVFERLNVVGAARVARFVAEVASGLAVRGGDGGP